MCSLGQILGGMCLKMWNSVWLLEVESALKNTWRSQRLNWS